MKEDGEITDDEDEQVSVKEIPLTGRKPPLREFNRKRKHSGDSARHSVSSRHDKQKSYRSKRSRSSSYDNTRNTTAKDPPVSSAASTLPSLEICLSTHPSTPPVSSTSAPSGPSVKHSRSESPSSRVDKNTGTGRKSVDKGCHMLSSHGLFSYTVSDSSDAEVITIVDSEEDGSDEGLILDEDDLDELQLRREAVISLLGAERSHLSLLHSSSSEQNLTDTEHGDSVLLSTGSELNQSAELASAVANDVVVPASPSSKTACTLEDNADKQSNVASSTSSLTSASLTDVTYTSSVPLQSLTLPNDPSVILPQPNTDNYDEVEMDLDSASESETNVLSSCEEHISPLPESIPDAADQNFAHIPPTSTSSQAGFNSPPMITHSQPLSSLSDSVVTQFFPAAIDSNTVVMSHFPEGTIDDCNVPVPLHTKTEIVDSGSPQQQRKVKDADEKSELLLRAEVLRSLSSKRQQQQQQLSHSDATSSIPRERLQAIKRTITPTSPAGSQSQLPVHQPVVISLNAESSDSDDAEQPETVPVCVQSSMTASDLSTNLDRVLREIRKAHDTTSSQMEATSSVKYPGKHNVSEPALANQHMPSYDASSLPFSPLPHNQTAATKISATSCSAGMGGASAKLDENETSLQKLLLCSLAREKRKLQQQKMALSKAKLRMARKREQIDAADRRVKKLQEQLQAAEKIAISSKKQLHSLQQETLTLSSGIEQHQNAIRKLEQRLSVTQKIPTSVNESGSDSENFQRSEMLFSNKQSTDAKTSYKYSDRTTNISHVPSSVTHHPVSVSFSSSVPTPTLSTSQACQSTFSNKSCSTQRTQAQNATETQALQSLKRLQHPNVTGTLKSESDVSLVNDKSVNREPPSETKCKEVESNQNTEQQIKPLFPNVSREHAVSHDQNPNVCAMKPFISVAKPDVPFVQKTGAQINDDVAMVSGKTNTSHKSSETMMPSDKKINQILHHYNNSLDRNLALNSAAAFSRLLVSDPVFSFQFPIGSALPVATSFLTADTKSDALDVGSAFEPYHSSLLCFRSYMFSDFFQQKGLSLSSETFALKLDCHVPLCQFDLMGKCLDEGCSLQHRSDYTLSKKEQLLDIVSYCPPPPVASADSSTLGSQCEQLVNQYVEKFCKDTGSQLSHSGQCRCLIDRVKTAAGLTHPHAVCTSARRWKLHGSKQQFGAGDKNGLLFSLDEVSEIPESVAGGFLATEDIRYWMAAESDQISNLEEAVATTPSDESLWIKLAYAKMAEMRWSTPHDECISYGLNVLARAVEASPSSSNLWTHYLDLYMSRSQAESDASQLYDQAVQYAPSYEFFWKYLQLPVSYSQKMDICKRLRQYLCSPRCSDAADKRSHHLLETVLYQAALCTISGHYKDGLQVIQAIVQSKASVIWLTLTPCDRIIMWLSFIHLYECRQLPKTLFDPSNSNPGPIVQKEPFIVPFQIGKKTRISYETLLQLFGCAFSACDKDIKPLASDLHDEYLDCLSALYRSRILLELSYHGWAGAQQLAEQFLQQRPYLLDVWFLLLQLVIASTDNTTDHKTLARSVSDTVEKALTSNAHSVPLYLASVCALIECGETEGALTFAERCPISLFEVDLLDSTVDPNLLFCCLLRQPLPPNYTVPALHPSVSWQYTTDQQANLWLSYCLLLDLQGAHDQASETYHIALSCLRQTKDIQRLLIAYLRRTSAVISNQLKWLTPVSSSQEQKRNRWQEFESEIGRALFSLPVRRSVPHSSQTWDDYSSHNEIIKLQISCFSDMNQVQDLYEKYLVRMPANVDLVLDCVNSLLGRDSVQLAQGLCLVALHSCPRSAALWNIVLGLCRRTSGAAGLMRALHSKSTKVLPFSASLWKLCIMSEVINKSQGRVQEAVENCRRLQVNVDGFLDSLLK